MNEDAKRIVSEMLDLVSDILDDVADGTDDLSDAKKAYRKKVNRYRNKLWREHIYPALAGLDDDEWVDDAADALALVRLILRRWG